MTVLAIIGVIVLLLFLLLMTSVKVRIISDGEITLKVGAGPVMIKLLPKKNKRKKIKKFTQKRYLALVEEHRAVIRAKDDAKEAKKASKKDKKHIMGENEQGSVENTVSFVLKVLDRLDTYTGRLRTVIHRFDVTVGGSDVAKTAVTYGIVSQSVSYLLELLDCKTRLKIADPALLSGRCDFIAEGLSFAADLTIKLRILDALRTGVDVLLIKLNHDSETAFDNKRNNARKAGNNNGRK